MNANRISSLLLWAQLRVEIDLIVFFFFVSFENRCGARHSKTHVYNWLYVFKFMKTKKSVKKTTKSTATTTTTTKTKTCRQIKRWPLFGRKRKRPKQSKQKQILIISQI